MSFEVCNKFSTYYMKGGIARYRTIHFLHRLEERENLKWHSIKTKLCKWCRNLAARCTLPLYCSLSSDSP